jgi:hypothetical protein
MLATAAFENAPATMRLDLHQASSAVAEEMVEALQAS